MKTTKRPKKSKPFSMPGLLPKGTRVETNQNGDHIVMHDFTSQDFRTGELVTAAPSVYGGRYGLYTTRAVLNNNDTETTHKMRPRHPYLVLAFRANNEAQNPQCNFNGDNLVMLTDGQQTGWIESRFLVKL